MIGDMGFEPSLTDMYSTRFWGGHQSLGHVMENLANISKTGDESYVGF